LILKLGLSAGNKSTASISTLFDLDKYHGCVGSEPN
jgi:hypothetical protein